MSGILSSLHQCAAQSGATYNINAEMMAGAIAAALGAERWFMLTDVVGVLDKSGALLTDLVPADVAALRADGTISGVMIPKLETCVHVLRGAPFCASYNGLKREESHQSLQPFEDLRMIVRNFQY